MLKFAPDDLRVVQITGTVFDCVDIGDAMRMVRKRSGARIAMDDFLVDVLVFVYDANPVNLVRV